jgi:hypothetical protein
MKKYCSSCGFGNQYEDTPPTSCAKCKKGMAKVELPKNLVALAPESPKESQRAGIIVEPTYLFNSKEVVEPKVQVEIDLEKKEPVKFAEVASQSKTNFNRSRQKIKKSKVSNEEYFAELRQSMKRKDIEIGGE